MLGFRGLGLSQNRYFQNLLVVKCLHFAVLLCAIFFNRIKKKNKN